MDDPYYHDKLMGRTYAEQDIKKIEALKEYATKDQMEKAIDLQVIEYERRLQEAIALSERSGIAHYAAYLATLKNAFARE